MNVLKSLFISTFPVLALVGSIISILALNNQVFNWQYVGLLLVSLPIILFFALVFINKKPRTTAYLLPYTSPIILGLIISIIGFFQSHLTNMLTLSILIAGSWILYLAWYSKFTNRSTNPILQIGQTLPSFQLEDTQQKTVKSEAFEGNPSIYLFYRGNWCPLCMAQIKEIAVQYKELEKRGVNMVLVSPQPHKYTASLAKKFQLGFHFLVDKGNKVAKQLQILGENGLPFGFQALGYESDTVMPTVVITDKKGKIVFADLTDNYRVRPEPSTFLKV